MQARIIVEYPSMTDDATKFATDSLSNTHRAPIRSRWWVPGHLLNAAVVNPPIPVSRP